MEKDKKGSVNVLKILLCCGGGFSSSYIVERMKKDILNNHLENDVMIEYSPFSLSSEVIDQFDVMICCPHLNVYVKQLVKEHDIPIPIYILPPRMYGNMEIIEIYQDVLDIIEIFNQTRKNPVHFPNEDNVLKIKRNKSYKKTFGTS